MHKTNASCLKTPHCRLVLYLILMFAGILPMNAQSLKFCGSYRNPQPVPREYQGIRISDRFGNEYTSEQLYEQQSHAKSACSSGAFSLNFIGSFPSDEEATICQVFQDVSDLIGGGSATIPINIIRETTGAPAAASDFFIGQCGLAHSSVLEIIRTGVNPLPPGIAAGVVHVRNTPTPNSTWHSLQDDPNGMLSSEYDLYSAIIHEALHVLGFASRIGLDGNALGGSHIYSDWDKFLYSNVKGAHLIVPDPNGACCGAYDFNHHDFPDMPNDLTGGCELKLSFLSGGSDIAPVNYVGLALGADNDMANKLSHLDKACGPDNYVMHPSLAPAEQRRTITGPEIQIICLLGYNHVGDCPDCFLQVNDDIITTPIILQGVGANNPLFIPFSTLLANDIFPGGDVALVTNCGDDDGITITQGATGFTVTGLIPGTWSFCYSITNADCGGCDQAEVRLKVLQSTDGCDPCDLTCYGSFEGFVPGDGVYNTQMGIPPFHIQGAANDNSVDIYTNVATNSTVLRWVNIQNGSWEVPRLPLSRHIPPGCEVQVTFQASAANIFGANVAATLGIYGITGPPCSTIVEPFCSPQFSLCPGINAFCMQGYTLQPDAGVVAHPGNTLTGVDLQSYSFTWTNTSTQDVTDILLYGTAPGIEVHQFILDNIHVILHCGNTVTVTPNVKENCIDGKVVIEYEVCLDDPGSIDLQANIPAIPGLSIAPGGGFDANGVAHITLPDGDATPNCTTVTLTLNAGANILPGTVLNVNLQVSTSGTVQDPCNILYGDTNVDVPVTMEECVNCKDISDISVTAVCEGDVVTLTVFDKDGNEINENLYFVHWFYNNNTMNVAGVNPLTLPSSTTDYWVTVFIIEGDVVLCAAEDTGRIVCDTLPSGCGITIQERCDSCGNVILVAVDNITGLPVNPSTYNDEFYWSIWDDGPTDMTVRYNNNHNPITVGHNACYSLRYNHYIYPPNVPHVPGYHTSICRWESERRCITLDCRLCEDFPDFFVAGCGDDLDVALGLTFPSNCQTVCGISGNSSGTLGVFRASDNSPVSTAQFNILWEDGSTGTYAWGSIPNIDHVKITEKAENGCCFWEDKYVPSCLCHNDPSYVHCEQPIVKHCNSDGTVTYSPQSPQIAWYNVAGATGYILEVTFGNSEEGCCKNSPAPGIQYINWPSSPWTFPSDWDCFTVRVKAVNPNSPCPETDWSEPYTYCEATNDCFPVIVVCGCCHERAGEEAALPTTIVDEETILAMLKSNPSEGYSTLREALNSVGIQPAVLEPLVSVFPNPAQTALTVRFKNNTKESENFTFEMFDTFGRRMLSRPLSGNGDQTLDISDFAAGVYTWHLINNSGEKVMEKGKVIVIP